MATKVRSRGKNGIIDRSAGLMTRRKGKLLPLQRAMLQRLARLSGPQTTVIVQNVIHVPQPVVGQRYPDVLLSEPYEWGPQGQPPVKPFRYIPGKGWDAGED